MKGFRKAGLNAGLVIAALLPVGELFAGETGIWEFRQDSPAFLNNIKPKHQHLLNNPPGSTVIPNPATDINTTTDPCLLSVLPGDTEHLKLTLATAPEHCSLLLTGTYELEAPLYINRPLKATAPEPDPNADDWFLPDKLVENQFGIQILCSSDSGQLICPGRQSGFSPTAVIIVRQGGLHFVAGGGLHQTGIVDARDWPENSTPVLQVSDSAPKSSPGFNQVFFKGQYPVVSDIDDSHPYWNNNEPADGIWGAGRAAAGRVFIWSRGVGERQSIRQLRNFAASAGSSGGGRRPPIRSVDETGAYSGFTGLVSSLKVSEAIVDKLMSVAPYYLGGLYALGLVHAYLAGKVLQEGRKCLERERGFMPQSGNKTDPGISMMITPINAPRSDVTGFNYDGRHIVTVNHISAVLTRDGDKAPPLVKCKSNNGSFQAAKVGSDKENDITVYRIEGDGKHFSHSFLDFPDADQDKNWRIYFAKTHTVAGVDSDEFNPKLASVRNYCFAGLLTPTRSICIGYLNAKPGYSGSPVFLEKKSKRMVVGMLIAGTKYPVINKDFLNEHVRTRKIHEVVQNIITNSPED